MTQEFTKVSEKRADIVAEPLVSVVIPTYKRSTDLLSRAIASVRSQSYQNIEIIIVDDSTAAFPQRDETESYIRSLNDDRIRYYQNDKNCGGCQTRNLGVSYARGEYIAFLDDDDEYMPGKIEKQVAFMRQEDLDLTLGDIGIFSENGELVDYREHKELTDFSTDALFRYHLRRHLTGTSSFMFRTEKLRQIGGFDDAKVGQEFFLMAKAIRSGLKIKYMHECVVKLYQHSGERISSGANKIEGEKTVFKYKKQFFPQLTAAERRYIRFRYHAVMAAAYKRRGRYPEALGSCVLTVVSAPVVFMREAWGFATRLFKSKKKFSDS